MSVRAIIPLAGVGSRLRPHTYSAPKALLHVAGKPILAHILDELCALDIRALTLVVGYRGEMIRDYVESNYSFETTYVQQDTPQGLGQAIHLTKDATRPDERLLIVLGDTVFKADLKAALDSDVSLIGVKEVGDPSRFGIIEMKGDWIVGLEEKPEKPRTNLAIVGIYYITEPGALYESLDEMIAGDATTKGEFQLTDALQMMVRRGVRIRPYPVDGWYDCGKPETLLQTNREMLAHLDAASIGGADARFPGCILNPPVSIAPTAQLENAIIGPHVTVADRAVIRNALIRDSIISRNAYVSNIQLEGSIISDNARVESKPFRLNIGDSSELNLG